MACLRRREAIRDDFFMIMGYNLPTIYPILDFKHDFLRNQLILAEAENKDTMFFRLSVCLFDLSFLEGTITCNLSPLK